MTLDLQDLIARLHAIERHAHNTEVTITWDDESKDEIDNYEHTFSDLDVFAITDAECKNNVTNIKITCCL